MEKFVTLSTGVRMGFVERGAPDGTPVILLHGVTDSWHSFERLLPLLPRGIHAFALSQVPQPFLAYSVSLAMKSSSK